MKKIITYSYNGIYIYSIDDNTHKGALKIGKFSIQATSKKDGLEPNSDLLRDFAINCINQQTSRAAIRYELLWAELAFYTVDGEDCMFDDHAVHAVLENSGYHKRRFNELSSNPQEWYEVDLETAKRAIQAVKENRNSLDFSNFRIEKREETPEIVFRKEQEDAINLALRIFRRGGKKVLWNAKMRFGKTLCALETIRRLGAKRTLLITHRPDVRKGWFTDFDLIKFEANHLRGAKKITRNDGYGLKKLEVLEQQARDNKDFKYLFFASIQDLRGGKNVGGRFDKNEDIFQTRWDYLIIDEAHEGTKTELGKKVIDELQKQKGIKTLYLSGTPYNILDNFESNEIFTWDYMMEQEAKARWDEDHPDKPNPYEELPRLNIFTYNLGNVFDYRAREDEDYFNFTEFFRVSDGSDDIEEGEFVHKDDVRAFLDLLCKEGTDSNYPYSTEEYRFSLAHTLWVIGGVKEGAALSRLINEHELHTKYGYKVVNVAGDGDPDDEEKNSEALKKVEKAIAENERTITLTCGRLTTGVTVREWTGVFMLAGAYSTRAATYLQTIFRCQSPSKRGVIPMKTECYAFDFAPDRSLVVINEAIAKNVKGGTNRKKQRDLIDRFLNFCPVIAMDGSSEVVYDTKTFISQVNRAYADYIVERGFSGRRLYTNLHTITDDDFAKLMEIGKLFSGNKSSRKKSDGRVIIADEGLIGVTMRTPTEDNSNPSPKQKNENKPRWERAMNVLNEISVRMPMMIFGLGIKTKNLSIDYFLDAIDDESWSVFMPKNLTKDDFKQIKHLYNDGCLEASAHLISERTQEADKLPILHRVPAVANIIEKFRFPDKETVLTPWRVVNMHLADTVGGWCFYDEEYTKEISEPRLVETDASKTIFTKDSCVLEINSKSGLYPLYVAYSLFRSRLEQLPTAMHTRENEEILWQEVLKKNLFVVCMSPMAVHITNRVLRGNHTDWHTNVCYLENLTNRIKRDIDGVVATITNAQTFNANNDNKNMKFTAIVGNPPYQKVNKGNGKGADPIYHLFIDSAMQIAEQGTLIHPARFLFNAGKTPKEWNSKILSNPHFRIAKYWTNSMSVFPTVDIKGGIAATYWNQIIDFGAIGTFIAYSELLNILGKVKGKSEPSLSTIIAPRELYGLTEELYKENPSLEGRQSKGHRYSLGANIFKVIPEVFTVEKTNETECVKVYGRHNNQRCYRWVKESYITHPNNLGKNKVVITKANGTGAFGEALSAPTVVGENVGYTDSFIGIGEFSEHSCAENCLRYIKTKFCRTLLGTIKVTQDNPKETWANVPIQDFSIHSDIDWSKSVAEIDQQLYAKYGLDESEIAFIESKIKPME